MIDVPPAPARGGACLSMWDDAGWEVATILAAQAAAWESQAREIARLREEESPSPPPPAPKPTPLSEAHRAKISAALRGRTYGPLSPETRAKISQAVRAANDRRRAARQQ